MPVYETNKPTKDGRKYYFKCYYKDKYGKGKRYESKLYLGKRECEREERKFLEETESNNLLKSNENVMFKDVFYEWWFYKSKRLKSTTSYGIKHTLEKHIYTFFKDYQLCSIYVSTINLWLEYINKYPIKVKTKNKIIGYLKNFFNYAVDNYNFDKRRICNLDNLRDDNIETVREVDWNYLTYDEFNKFIKVVDNNFWFTLFNFLYYTGLRYGECTALNWHDIDFKKKTVRVNKTLSNKVGNNSFLILPPKTNNSIRTVDLDDKLVDLLKKHYANESKLYNFDKSMFVFGNIKYTSDSATRRHLNKYLFLAKIKSKKTNYKEGESIITVHGFRHSHVSLLAHLGLDFKEVADRIGDTPSVVERVYYHIFPQKKSNTVNALNKLNEEL